MSQTKILKIKLKKEPRNFALFIPKFNQVLSFAQKPRTIDFKIAYKAAVLYSFNNRKTKHPRLKSVSRRKEYLQFDFDLKQLNRPVVNSILVKILQKIKNYGLLC